MDVLVPTSGKYVIAVSGGVDSVALLHHLQQQSGLKLTVAHYDHGIREDSHEDRRLVGELARSYGLPYIYDKGALGAGASEATARRARYDFLRGVQKASNARALITAHHQDDLLETAIINLLRGTGRKGLTALRSMPGLERPLLGATKQQIRNYASEQGLVWREDSTNTDEAYLRNYVRRRLLPAFDPVSRQRLLEIIQDLQQTNHELDNLLATHLHLQHSARELSRSAFVNLPHAVALEVMAAWLRAHDIGNFDRRTLERLVVAAKTATPGKTFPILGPNILEIKRSNLALRVLER